MVATNFCSPYKWLPKLAAKFWLPNLVLYQTDIGGQKFEPHGSFFTQAWKYSQYACKASFWVNLALSTVWENGPRPPKFPISALFGTKNLASKGNFSHTLESTYNMPVNQVSESDINFFFWENGPKPPKFWGQKFGPQDSFFTHTWKYPQHACKPSFMGALWKLSEKMAKNLQNFQFWPIFCN